MIDSKELYNLFKQYNFNYFVGVPDSTFKDWMKFLNETNESLTHRRAAIERDAMAWASGYYIATGKTGIVYMQNSGLGNIVNPLTSLTDPEVYNIPILFMIGWRGEPGAKDEPQHAKMGRITRELLDLLEIKNDFLPDNIEDAERVIKNASRYITQNNHPYALLIRQGMFAEYKSKQEKRELRGIKREEAICLIMDSLSGDEVIVSTTGKTSRELFEYRESKKQGHQKDFLMVGSMGCAAAFAAEIALQKPNKKVIVLDGDGAIIMSAGSLSTIGHYVPRNLCHIVFDNGSYESTGGQPTTSSTIDFVKLALANGYQKAKVITNKENLIKEIKNQTGLQMLIVKVDQGSRKDLSRPTITPIRNKKDFMKFLN